ncbi:MAG: cytochrome c biogenesis protein CcsA [Candidatus Acidiferrales bacterium]
MVHILSYLMLALYFGSFVCYGMHLRAPAKWTGRIASLLLAAGMAAQYCALYQRSIELHAVPYDDLYGSMSLFAWLLALTYLGLELIHRQRAVGAFVAAVLVIWLSSVWLLVPDPTTIVTRAGGPVFALHVTLNTWAYAAFALSFILSGIYVAQDRLLRSRRLGAAFWRFPALDVLEKMSRSSVIVGLVALSVGVTMGVLWQHRTTGSVSLSDPKVVITMAIAGVYLAYLALSWTATWRGARAAMLCVGNFLVVLFSYTFVNLYLTRFHRYL